MLQSPEPSDTRVSRSRGAKFQRFVSALAILLNSVVGIYGSIIGVSILREDENEGTLWFLIVPLASILAVVALCWKRGAELKPYRLRFVRKRHSRAPKTDDGRQGP